MLVLIIVIGLCVLPALYAWFNIYANWDPYGNTGNIAIAVVNLDKGWTKNDSETVNMGDGVVESLKQKDTIGWKFVKSEEKAVEGVKSGRYYSALVIDEQFTYSMYHGVADNIENPRITYYLNDKKNAVATKITDSAASAEMCIRDRLRVCSMFSGESRKTNLNDDGVCLPFIRSKQFVRSILKGSML